MKSHVHSVSLTTHSIKTWLFQYWYVLQCNFFTETSFIFMFNFLVQNNFFQLKILKFLFKKKHSGSCFTGEQRFLKSQIWLILDVLLLFEKWWANESQSHSSKNIAKKLTQYREYSKFFPANCFIKFTLKSQVNSKILVANWGIESLMGIF